MPRRIIRRDSLRRDRLEGQGLNDMWMFARGRPLYRSTRVAPTEEELPLGQRLRRDHPMLAPLLPNHFKRQYDRAMRSLEDAHTDWRDDTFKFNGDDIWRTRRNEGAEDIRAAINLGQAPFYHRDLSRLRHFGITLHSNADPPGDLYATEVLTPDDDERAWYMTQRSGAVLSRDSGYRPIEDTFVED